MEIYDLRNYKTSYWFGETICFNTYQEGKSAVVSSHLERQQYTLTALPQGYVNLLLCRSMGPWSSRHIALHKTILSKLLL